MAYAAGVEMVRKLLRHGAPPLAPNAGKKTPAQVLLFDKEPQVVTVKRPLGQGKTPFDRNRVRGFAFGVCGVRV